MVTTVTAIEDMLVRSCVNGDSAAWRAMHRRYYPVAVAFLRKLGARESDIDDACQDVFVELFRHLPEFRGQSDLKTWLYRLCVTQARRTRTRSQVFRVLKERLEQEPLDIQVPAAMSTESTMVGRVSDALNLMNEGDRLVFVLYEFEGIDGKQIAEIANCPLATVWRRLHYARRIFKEAFGMAEVSAVGQK